MTPSFDLIYSSPNVLHSLIATSALYLVWTSCNTLKQKLSAISFRKDDAPRPRKQRPYPLGLPRKLENSEQIAVVGKFENMIQVGPIVYIFEPLKGKKIFFFKFSVHPFLIYPLLIEGFFL